jgi:PST family polysaccharide transporter
MTLIKASFWNGLAIAVRLLSALALNKVVAVLLGPAGYAMIGQFQNGFSMITSFSSTAIQPGVVKALAEAGPSEDRRRRVFSTALTVVVIASLCIGAALALGADAASRLLLQRGGFALVFVLLGVCLLPINLGNLLLSLLNGMKAFREYSLANVASTLLGLALTLILTWRFGVQGALASLAAAPALSLATTWLMSRTSLRTVGGFASLGFDRLEGLRLGKFALMGLTTAIVTPLSQILIRQMIAHAYGLDSAGLWDALNKMSNVYLAFFITTMSVYYLPKISEAKDWPELSGDMARIGLLLVSSVTVCAVVIFLFRARIITLLFSGRFAGMSELVGWQVCGDVAKVASWVVAYIMVGRGKTALFIGSEIVASGTLVGLTQVFLRSFGFAGAPMAYMVTYILYGLTFSAWFLSTPSRRAAIFR